jgi:hypothetical protein
MYIYIAAIGFQRSTVQTRVAGRGIDELEAREVQQLR